MQRVAAANACRVRASLAGASGSSHASPIRSAACAVSELELSGLARSQSTSAPRSARGLPACLLSLQKMA